MNVDESTGAPSSPSFGELLRQSRAQQGLSIREVARLLGTSPSTVLPWERDESVPSSRYLTQLARVLEISTDALYAAAGIDLPHDAGSVPAMLRAGYDDLPPEAIAKIERYVARTARQYGATKKTTNNSSPAKGGHHD